MVLWVPAREGPAPPHPLRNSHFSNTTMLRKTISWGPFKWYYQSAAEKIFFHSKKYVCLIKAERGCQVRAKWVLFAESGSDSFGKTHHFTCMFFPSFRLRFAESSKFLGKCWSFDRFTEPRGANDVRKSVTSGQAGFCFSIGKRESHSFSRCGNYMYLFWKKVFFDRCQFLLV